jgi:TRAP-type C4-dicarboxylate transport system, small permease component
MRTALKILNGIEVVILLSVLVLLVGCTFAGVIFRYVLNSPFTWMEEVQVASMVWLSFLGASLAFRNYGHVAIEVVVDALPALVRRIAPIVIGVIVYAILGYLFVCCIDFLEVFARTGRSTPVLRIPYALVYGIAPVSIVLMAISYSVAEFVPALRELARRGRGTETEETAR